MHRFEGRMTEREKELMFYLGNCIADYIEKHKSTRQEMLCALSLNFHALFSKDTPIVDVEEQCAEIDSFCDYLKFRARRHGKKEELMNE
jgi:hypothetical protein